MTKKFKRIEKGNNIARNILIGMLTPVVAGLILYYIFGIGKGSSNLTQQSHSGIGDNVAGSKIIIRKNLFSDIQVIRILPPSLGGKDTLNLDNLAALKLSVPTSEKEITFILDVVPIELPPQNNENFKSEGLQYYSYSPDQKILFDTDKNKRHEIKISGRTFIVTLMKIRKLEIAKVQNALEYEFGISEVEN